MCIKSLGHIRPLEIMSRSDLLIIVDEAQSSYAETDFWLECIKNRLDETDGPLIILFSSFGSASSTVLQVSGSAPITLEAEQRVSLTPLPNWPHDIGLCFTPEEVRDLCWKLIGERNFTVHPDVLERLFVLTDGHPGLTKGLLRSLFERKVSELNLIPLSKS
jgi:hypothetical protein